MTDLVTRLLIIFFGMIYPAYSSYKAIKYKDKHAYGYMMIYWIVFAFFSGIEAITDIFLSWIPFYFTFKVLFVVWLAAPVTRGSLVIYNYVVLPELAHYEPEIERLLSDGHQVLRRCGAFAARTASQLAVTAFFKGYTLVIDHVRRQQVAALEHSADVVRALPHRTTARPASEQIVAPETNASRLAGTIVLRRAQSSASAEAPPPPQLNVRRVVVHRHRQNSPLRAGQRPPVSRVVAVSEESSSTQGTYLDAGGPALEIEEIIEYLDDDEDLSDGARAAAASAQMEPTAPDEIPDEAADRISVLDPFGEDNAFPPLATPPEQSPAQTNRPPLQTSRAQPDSSSSRYSSSGALLSSSSNAGTGAFSAGLSRLTAPAVSSALGSSSSAASTSTRSTSFSSSSTSTASSTLIQSRASVALTTGRSSGNGRPDAGPAVTGTGVQAVVRPAVTIIRPPATPTTASTTPSTTASTAVAKSSAVSQSVAAQVAKFSRH